MGELKRYTFRSNVEGFQTGEVVWADPENKKVKSLVDAGWATEEGVEAVDASGASPELSLDELRAQSAEAAKQPAKKAAAKKATPKAVAQAAEDEDDDEDDEL